MKVSKFTHDWLCSYLTNHRQRVILKGINLKTHIILGSSNASCASRLSIEATTIFTINKNLEIWPNFLEILASSVHLKIVLRTIQHSL